MATTIDAIGAEAFPSLAPDEMAALRCVATTAELADGEIAFKAGDADIDLFVVESGQLDILNPTDNNRLIVTHEPGEFAGDIDLLTRRPVIVTAVARGLTRVLRVPGSKMREVLNRVPRLGEKMLSAFTLRREALQAAGVLGLKVVGPGRCKDTGAVREFLHKNFVPFTWFDPETPKGRQLFEHLGSPRKTPAIEFADGRVMLNPSLPALAQATGIWRACTNQNVDFAIIGAGPAGMAAAVYSASEGLSTLVLDRFGPGGQAGASSRIENFIGFPAGLSGNDLAARAVLQMLKFGARLAAPICVDKLIPATEPGQEHVLRLDCGAEIHSRCILIATGVNWRRLEARDAERFTGAGIYYACTSVEAVLFDKCDVAVVGAGNSAGQAVMFLAECCRDRKVHMLIRKKLGPGMSEYLVSRIRAASNVVVHEGVEISAVAGRSHVKSVELTESATGQTSELPCEAVFVFIGAEPSCTWLPDGIARDSLGYLLTGVDAAHSGRWPLTDRDPLPLETSIPGILAAGDVRAGSTKRVGFAVGDGSLAVTCVHRLRTLPR